jgi:hypothetical protein
MWQNVAGRSRNVVRRHRPSARRLGAVGPAGLRLLRYERRRVADRDAVTQGIVRIGDTVHRPVRPFSLTVQAYLAHLRDAGSLVRRFRSASTSRDARCCRTYLVMCRVHETERPPSRTPTSRTGSRYSRTPMA